MKRFLALVLAAVMLFSFSACGSEYKVKNNEDFKAWFNQALVPSYEAYRATVDKNAVIPSSVALILSTDEYIKSVLDYVTDGVFPETGEITEEDGAYLYTANLFKQRIELDAEKCAIRITMLMDFVGDGTTEFVVVLAEKKGEYFIQYVSPLYGEYYEIRFDGEEGSFIHKSDCYEAPYDIFNEDIPKNFAKETQ